MLWPVAAFPVWFCPCPLWAVPLSAVPCAGRAGLWHQGCSAVPSALLPSSQGHLGGGSGSSQLPGGLVWPPSSVLPALAAQSWLWRCLEAPLAVLRGSRRGQVHGPFGGPVAEPCMWSPPRLRSSLPISPWPLLITNERRQRGTGAPSSSAQGGPRLQRSFLPPEEIIPRHLFISFPPTGFACFLFS